MSKSKMGKIYPSQRGVRLNINGRQIVVSFVLVFVMLVLPIILNENKDKIENYLSKQKNPYSSEVLAERQKVAGASTTKNNSLLEESSSQKLILPIINLELDITEQTLPFIVVSVILGTAGIFMALYVVLGKFEGA